jgi:hypothetical protein
MGGHDLSYIRPLSAKKILNFIECYKIDMTYKPITVLGCEDFFSCVNENYEGWYESIASYFSSETVCTIVLKFTYIMGKSFTKLMIFSHKIPIMNTLFPPLCEMLYSIHVKIFAEALEHFTHIVFQLLVHRTVSLEYILQGAEKMEIGLC